MMDTKQAAKKRAAPRKRKPEKAAQSAQSKRSLPVVETMAVAESLGFPRAFLKRAKKAGCPAFRLGNRIDIESLIRWLFAESKEDNVDWGKRKTKAAAERDELRLAKERQQVGDRGEMRAAMQAAFAIYDSEIERQFLTVQPPKAIGLTAAEISQLNKSLIQRGREEAHKALSNV